MSPTILFEDSEIIVCIKPAGVTSEDGVLPGMPSMLERDGKKPLVVHRLDREVSGVMVFAKTKSAASKLSAQIVDKSFKKQYAAVVDGHVESMARLEHLLFHDRSKNKTFVVDRQRAGVKKAILNYKKLGETEYNGNKLSLLNIDLETGRTHQIRVQLAYEKASIFGDKRYGSKFGGNIALFSKGLSFRSPTDDKELKFLAPLPNVLPWNLF